MKQNTILTSRYNRPSMEITILTMIQMAVDIVIMPTFTFHFISYITRLLLQMEFSVLSTNYYTFAFLN